MNTEKFIQKRIEKIKYIRKVHQGDVYWLNVYKLTQNEILQNYSEDFLQKRIEQFFNFGMSLSLLLQSNKFLINSLKLFEEFESNYTSIKLWKQTNVYQFLKLHHIPCKLDYLQVFNSFCDILIFSYRKLLEESFENILKFDEKVKIHFFDVIHKELTNLSLNKMFL